MATISFEKDFIVTNERPPFREKASAHFETKKFEWTPVDLKEITDEEFVKWLME